MKASKPKKYTNEKIEPIKIVNDFLPSPEQLVTKEETIKITLSVTKNSVNYFKEQAKIHHTQYQKMMRALLDQYVAFQLNHSSKRSKIRKLKQG